MTLHSLGGAIVLVSEFLFDLRPPRLEVGEVEAAGEDTRTRQSSDGGTDSAGGQPLCEGIEEIAGPLGEGFHAVNEAFESGVDGLQGIGGSTTHV